MSTHPVNLGFRFLLEMAALAALAVGGAGMSDSAVVSTLLSILLPITGAVLWGTFRVPGDASHSGHAPVTVSGAIRLLLEAALFTAAVTALAATGHQPLALALTILLTIHYALSIDRIAWLLR